jgi:TonB-like protein
MRQRSPNSHRALLLLGCVLTLLAIGPVQFLGQTSSPKARGNWSCLRRRDLWRDQKGRPRWLNSDELKDRTEASRPIERPGALGKNSMKGSITIELVIDSDGKVVCARGVKGHPIAIAAALKSIRHWSFKPVLVDGKSKAMAGSLTLTYDFSE